MFLAERYIARLSSVGWAFARRLALAAALRSGGMVTGFHQDLCLNARSLGGDDELSAVVKAVVR